MEEFFQHKNSSSLSHFLGIKNYKKMNKNNVFKYSKKSKLTSSILKSNFIKTYKTYLIIPIFSFFYNIMNNFFYSIYLTKTILNLNIYNKNFNLNILTRIKLGLCEKQKSNEFYEKICSEMTLLSLKMKRKHFYSQLKFYRKNFYLIDLIYHGAIQIFHSLYVGNYTLILNYYKLQYFYSIINIINIKRKNIFCLVLILKIQENQQDQLKTSIVINNIKWS
ncbi:hypothetical protein BNATCHR293 (nucleomorph) [Bigelowiella natans]|uniref:Uncharacterized protein n=1 Tax=Bigelowiella natans TaxID=227086 RepID=Q3LW82_BIGNA|nr:hypothetical protein BNATCHR293 [Bigelowiella natans]ABA27284.1 hypothetical protein [Bigelowiella natans]|mmetsp:Transcript_5155/g.8392  ORF Transcript_5155/g.8392 Transcript_5155/m.8392 type:complete len:221 (-) Transcript_5155:662-1324(-)